MINLSLLSTCPLQGHLHSVFVNSYMAQLGSQRKAHLSNNGSANTLVKLKCICAVYFFKTQLPFVLIL